jgi:Transaldolase/Fructose-6-phosphate aldolase
MPDAAAITGQVIDQVTPGMATRVSQGMGDARGLMYPNPADLSRIRSVASFFVSRMDTEIDAELDELGTAEAAALRGKAAIANARLAYQLFERRLAGQRWHALRASGAQVQRPVPLAIAGAASGRPWGAPASCAPGGERGQAGRTRAVRQMAVAP